MRRSVAASTVGLAEWGVGSNQFENSARDMGREKGRSQKSAATSKLSKGVRQRIEKEKRLTAVDVLLGDICKFLVRPDVMK